MRTSGHKFISLVTNNFSSELIEFAKSVLSELLPHNTRWITYRRQKDINNVRLRLQELNKCAEDVSRSVSYFLDDLTPNIRIRGSGQVTKIAWRDCW